MFWRTKTEQLYEARIADLKKEHQRTVEALTAWIEQLQLQVGAAVPGTPPAYRAQASGSTESPNVALYMGEEEESLYDAHANSLITDEQLQEGLQQIGFLNKEVIAS